MIRAWATTLAACMLVAGFTVFYDRPSFEIEANDNRMPAGELRDGVLTLNLVAAQGTWYPEAGAGPGREIFAFGERLENLSNPGPLIRVPVGTEVRATVRNHIEGETLVVHGLHGRPGTPDTIHVPPGGTRTVRFRTSVAGTFFYWGTTRAARTLIDRWGKESQLHGALIVDPPGPVVPDRVFIIGIDEDSGDIPARRPLNAAVLNGRSWPHTEQLSARVGDTIRMRWINPSSRRHPIHLHGFYFRVESHGDLAQDTIYRPADQRLAVTELMQQGQTFTLRWIPERAGNWLMHCHMAEHINPKLRRGERPNHDEHSLNHALDVMSGLVLGWRVLPAGDGTEADQPIPPARTLRLVAKPARVMHGSQPGLGFILQDHGIPAETDSVRIPGPPLVLVRGEPVLIRVVNQLTAPTSIHWHGIELESYFDGVSGWSGDASRTSPQVEPGDSFDVQFTPPRVGTFIYHSHWEEERQLGSGMFGPIIVLDKGEVYDPRTDHAWILSQGGWIQGDTILLNGSSSPVMELQAGQKHRVRLINISPSIPLTFQLLADSVPVAWRAIAKDGADLPLTQRRTQPAHLQIGVGETYDFEISSEQGPLRVVVRDPAGVVRLRGEVRSMARVRLR